MKTNIVNKFTLNSACYAPICKKFDYIMNSARISAGGLQTDCIDACIAGSIGNGKHNLMFHLAPEQQSLRTLPDIAKRKLEQLLEKTEGMPLNGFLFGGWASTVADKETALLGTKLYNTMAEIMEDFGAKLSLICGNNKPHSQGALFSRDDRIALQLDNFKKMGLDPEKIKNMPQEKVRDFLEDLLSNHYETVELHPAHFFKLA